MWSRIDDGFISHPKLCDAAELLGGQKSSGGARAGFLFLHGLVWSNQHGTDGHLPINAVKNFQHVAHPLKVAEVLVTVNLWEKATGGFQIHDFLKYNLAAAQVADRRAQIRDVRAQAGRRGGLTTAQRRKGMQ